MLPLLLLVVLRRFTGTVVSFVMVSPTLPSRTRVFAGVDTNDDSSWDSRKAQKISVLEDLNKRLHDIDALESLKAFYEPKLNSFTVQPNLVERISVTSTCYALLALLQFTGSKGNRHDFQLQSILQALMKEEWRKEDLFQTPLLLYTLLRLAESDSSTASSLHGLDKIQSLIQVVVEARPRRRRFANQQQYSDYILYRLALTYVELYKNFDSRVQDEESHPYQKNDLYIALSRCVETSYIQVCQQLALRAANDRSSFDVMRLIYSLLTYVVSTRAIAGTVAQETSSSGIPKSRTPPSQSSPQVDDIETITTLIKPLNDRVIRCALQAFFHEQNESGLWDKGQPIYRSFRRIGRSVGNAFIFGTDTLASVLETFQETPEYFRPYLSELSNTLQWIETHRMVWIYPDYCDPQTGECYGKPVSGWKSPHLDPESGPQGWSTAQTVHCLQNMRLIVQKLLHMDVLEEFGGKFIKSANSEAWDRLLDSDIGDCGTGQGCLTLKSVLSQRMIEPFSPSLNGRPVVPIVYTSPCYSAILFGPPGTAKTTIAESLALRLGWDFLVIDTSCFLADGLSNVASRIRYVFDRLQFLESCVILFDEIEEFCLDRETPGLGMESRMLTTAMLTAINDLRRKQSSIFFLATNRLRAFDSAITRPGRFDLQLFVGTPNLASRKVQLETALSKIVVAPNDDSDEVKSSREEALEVYLKFLEKEWENEARFMNYLEGVQFANACARLLVQDSGGGGGGSPPRLTEEKLSKLLYSQSSLLTIRGTVRDEFVASMGLSRI